MRGQNQGAATSPLRNIHHTTIGSDAEKKEREQVAKRNFDTPEQEKAFSLLVDLYDIVVDLHNGSTVDNIPNPRPDKESKVDSAKLRVHRIYTDAAVETHRIFGSKEPRVFLHLK